MTTKDHSLATEMNKTATNAEPEPQGPTANAAQHLVDGVARVLTKPRFKPRFRGWIHVYSAGIAEQSGFLIQPHAREDVFAGGKPKLAIVEKGQGSVGSRS